MISVHAVWLLNIWLFGVLVGAVFTKMALYLLDR